MADAVLGELAKLGEFATAAAGRFEQKFNHVLDVGSWDLERRGDGAVIVRVHSQPAGEQTLPDAVFAFRAGDPQFAYWERQWREQQRAAN